jgi:hypothetical protein
MLRGLSDADLLSRVKNLVGRERAVTLEILVHLTEVERRRLHLNLGYASMFDYCTRHVGYSSSAASRRIQAARCIRDYPQVLGLLEKNEINLVTVSLVASIVTAANANDLFVRIRGKTQREVEEIAAEYRPPVSMRDRVKPVWVKVAQPVVEQPVSCGQSYPITPSGGSGISPKIAADSAGGPPEAASETQAQPQAGTGASADFPSPPAPRIEEKDFIQFVASKGFMRKFEKAKALLSNGKGDLSFEAVLEAALDEFLKDNDPEERNKRREERKQRAESKVESGAHRAIEAVGSRAEGGIGGAGSEQADDPLFRRWIGGLSASRVPANDEGASRRIPAALRDAVFARDQGKCTYRGSEGRRCESSHNLQIDHIVPFARGGAASLTNLRLLCGKHNRLAAERIFGRPAAYGKLEPRKRGRLI